MQQETILQIITRRRNQAALRQGYRSLFFRVLVIALAVWVLLSQVFLLAQADGSAMFPSIKAGDLLVAFRLQRDYEKDDVVVYQADGVRHIGRILGRAGDIITLDDSGTLLVNGTAQDGGIMYPTYAKEGMNYPYQVPDDCVFILGDYRTQSKDSRDFGAVAMENVEGKIITILRRRSL